VRFWGLMGLVGCKGVGVAGKWRDFAGTRKKSGGGVRARRRGGPATNLKSVGGQRRRFFTGEFRGMREALDKNWFGVL